MKLYQTQPDDQVDGPSPEETCRISLDLMERRCLTVGLMPAEVPEAMWPLPSPLSTPTKTPNEAVMPSPLFDGGSTLQHVLGPNFCVSGDHRPPPSPQHNQPAPSRVPPPVQGNVALLLVLQTANATPSLRARRPISPKNTVHSESRGNPSSTTSNLIPSPALCKSRSRSRTKTLVAARLPVSQQILAATLSTVHPLLPRTPARAHAAR